MSISEGPSTASHVFGVARNWKVDMGPARCWGPAPRWWSWGVGVAHHRVKIGQNAVRICQRHESFKKHPERLSQNFLGCKRANVDTVIVYIIYIYVLTTFTVRLKSSVFICSGT